MNGKLGAVMLYAEDHVGLAEWYEKKLGLPRAESYEPSHSGCVHHGIYFGFTHCKSTPTPGAISLYFEVEDCDAEFEAAKERGAVPEQEPHDAHWGARVCSFLDPVGNRVWFYRYLPEG